MLSLNMEWVVQSHIEMMRLDSGGECQNDMVETWQNVPVDGYRKAKSWQKPKTWLQHRHYSSEYPGSSMWTLQKPRCLLLPREEWPD